MAGEILGMQGNGYAAVTRDCPATDPGTSLGGRRSQPVGDVPAGAGDVIRGGQPGRSAQGRRLQTRPVGSIDRGVSLNRALWMLAEEMRKLKA